MSIQNIDLRNYAISNFMNEVPKIRHQANEEEINITEKKISYNDQEDSEEKEENAITYKYLDDDILSQQFLFNKENDYNLHLCLFQVIQTNKNPFLQYFSIKNEEIKFPEAVLDKDEFMINKENENKIVVKEDEETEETEETEEKQDNIFEKIKNVFTNFSSSVLKNDDTKDQEAIENLFEIQVFDFFKSATGVNVNNPKELFRGFLENDGHIYLFFDCSSIQLSNIYKLDLKEEKEFIKILIDDIIINKQVSDIPIDSRICDLFAENAFLTELKELDGSNVVNPIRCFLCREEEEQYKNVFYEDKKNEISLIQDKIFHPEFDYLYIFTDSPLVSENQSNIKSFALFVDRNIPIITESEEDIDKVKENIDDYNIIYFTKDAQKYYGVRDKSYFEEL